MRLLTLTASSGKLGYSEGFQKMRSRRDSGTKVNGLEVVRGDDCVKGGKCGRHELEIVLHLQETTDKGYLWGHTSAAQRKKKNIECYPINC